ncbi:MAG: transketolase C-terminal domain-containing protein, partial [bacterium]
LGPTHHTTEDIALMRTLPNMTIFSPIDPLETKKATIEAARIKGPVYLRLATDRSPEIYKEDYEFKTGCAIVLREGKNIAIISTGGIVYEVLKAVDELESLKISVRLINIHTIKPIDKEIILKAASDIGAILTVEEHTVIGGLGSAVSEVLLENNSMPIKFKRLGLNGIFAEGYGSYEEMKEMNGLSKRDIVEAVKNMVKN